MSSQKLQFVFKIIRNHVENEKSFEEILQQNSKLKICIIFKYIYS